MKNFKNKVRKLSKEVEHVQSVLNGLNFLIEKKAIVIDGDTVFLYPELWGKDEKKIDSWKKNIYLYVRLKRNFPKGNSLSFRDIETREYLGSYSESTG